MQATEDALAAVRCMVRLFYERALADEVLAAIRV
jgi:truncated hemoglobin YjbI